MSNLLIFVVVLTIITQLINTIGAKQINNLLWSLYTQLPTSTSVKVQQQTKLRGEIVTMRRELTATSSQDEFAKWAKLKRSLDKKTEEFEKANMAVNSVKTIFESQASIVRWTLTNGLKLGLQFWYTKSPMFWIHQGWVPGYIEWILSFPKAPVGSVSIQVWSFATSQVVAMVFALVMMGIGLVMGAGAETPFGVKVESEGRGEGKKVR